MKWFNTLSHNRWLEQETDRIFDFGKKAVVPTGFGWLGNTGQVKTDVAPTCGSPPACCMCMPWPPEWAAPVRMSWWITALTP